jgi:cell division protein ZapA (FtsZ GTPase activity inhibitor)
MRVTLLGTSLMVQSEKDLDHLQGVVHCFEKKIEEVKKHLPYTEPLKLSIIAALNIIDDLLSLQDSTRQQTLESAHDNEAIEVEKIAQHMIQKIDSALASNPLATK